MVTWLGARLQIRFLTRNGFVVVVDNHSNLDDTVITSNDFWVKVGRPCLSLFSPQSIKPLTASNEAPSLC